MALTVELLTNLFQSFMFVGFLYLFFDKPEGKLKRLLPFLVFVLLLFATATYMTFGGTFGSIGAYNLDSLIGIALLMTYAIAFLRGKIYLRIIMPIIDFGINAVVSYSFGFFVSLISGIPIEVSMVMSTGFRYFCIVVVNLTTALLLWFVLRFGSKRIRLSGTAEIIAFVVIPLLCIIILYCGFFIYQASGYKFDVVPYIVLICLSIVTVAMLVWIVLVRISKVNTMNTELLLASQREKLYEESILASNEQIEKISGIKHDMKNKLMSLEKLIDDGDYEQAMHLCEHTTEKLSSTYTPVNTSNPVLNAIVNVELEKAFSNSIDFSLVIGDYLTDVSSADTVSIVGNLCDNAIEYLVTQPEEMRVMNLNISSQLNFHIITCKNKIAESILENNPQLVTTKDDTANHGKGMDILRRIAKEYDGEVNFDEEDGYLSISVMVRKKN